jgi:hypothetical protein
MLYMAEFDSPNRILCYRLYGRITDEDLRELYVVGLVQVAELDPLSSILDLTNVISLKVSPQSARELARSAPTKSDRNRITVIVAPSDHMFEIAHLFQLGGERIPPNLHIVHKLADAYAVLGVQEFQFKRLPTT